MRKPLVVVLALLAACTAAPKAAPPTPTPSASVSPSATVSKPPAVPAFSVANVVRTIREIVTRAPYRVAGSAAYGVAGSIVEAKFRALGYTVKRQPFSVPAGKVNLIPVPAGTTFNVVAEPPGFDPTKPPLRLRGHLDRRPTPPGTADH